MKIESEHDGDGDATLWALDRCRPREDMVDGKGKNWKDASAACK